MSKYTIPLQYYRPHSGQYYAEYPFYSNADNFKDVIDEIDVYLRTAIVPRGQWIVTTTGEGHPQGYPHLFRTALVRIIERVK